MAIQKVVEDINTIDEPLRALYVQAEDGRHVLDVEDKEVSKLRSHASELLSEKKNVQKENEKLKAMVEKLSQQSQSQGQNEDVVSSMRKNIEELRNQVVEERKLRDERESKFFLEKEVTRLGQSLFGQKLKPFKKDIESMLCVEDVEGQKVIRVLGKDGQVDYTRSVEDLERDLKSPGSDYADFIIASQASGSGVRPGSTTTFNPNAQKGPVDYRQKFIEDAKKIMKGLD